MNATHNDAARITEVEAERLDEFERRADLIDARLDYVEFRLAHRLTILSTPALKIGSCACGWNSGVVGNADADVVVDGHESHVDALWGG